jgi:PAS domain S-box-containing protein
VDGLAIVYLTRLANRTRLSLQENIQRLSRANKATNEALAHSRALIELAPDAFFQADLNARFTDVNGAACRLLDYDKDELVGKTIFDIIPKDDASRLVAVKTNLLVPGQIHRDEWALIRKDGTHVPVDISANILPDGRWQAFVRDISEHKRRGRALTESESRFRTLAEALPQIVWIARPDGWNTYIGQQWVTYTGLTMEESLGEGWNRPFHPDDQKRAWDAWQYAVHTDSAYSLECRLRRADGTYRWFLVRGVSLHDDMGKVISWFGTATDVDDLKRAEEALRRARDEAEAASERLRQSERALQQAVAAREQMLGIVAHDLRNPLSAIIMQSSALERRAPEAERRNQRPRRVISHAAARMNHLIQDLLDVSLVEAGHLTIERKRLSAGELAAEAVDMQASLASSAGVEVKLEVRHGLHEVWADRERIHQALENLIGNAIKFTKAGGHITVGVAPQDPAIVFWVADTGRGIAPESLPHVFDRFWQATTRAGRLGAGLGLPITKGIVEAHGGHIWVESTLGRGSTFYFSIPAAYSATESPSDVIH